MADGIKEPPREVTFPIRPHWFSVGLFAAGILQHNRTGQDEKSRFAILAGSAGRGPCVKKDKASRSAVIITVSCLENYLQFKFFLQPLNLCLGLDQFRVQRGIFLPKPFNGLQFR